MGSNFQHKSIKDIYKKISSKNNMLQFRRSLRKQLFHHYLQFNLQFCYKKTPKKRYTLIPTIRLSVDGLLNVLFNILSTLGIYKEFLNRKIQKQVTDVANRSSSKVIFSHVQLQNSFQLP